MSPLPVGAEAPDFTLRDQNNEKVVLSSFRGERAVLLVFYPWAFTGICTSELTVLSEQVEEYEAAGVEVFTVSVDSVYSQKIFAEREGFQFRLLADYWPHGEVAQAYGVFNDKAGTANRGTFLVDREGIIRFSEMNEIGYGRDAHAWFDAVKELG